MREAERKCRRGEEEGESTVREPIRVLSHPVLCIFPPHLFPSRLSQGSLTRAILVFCTPVKKIFFRTAN